MILLIDNYDSFSYNLYQLVGTVDSDIRVVRNDETEIHGIEQMAPSHIIISPGPGRPRQAGICEQVIDYFKDKIPILGVCLGHQAICETFGGVVSYAARLMHGKMSVIRVNTDSAIFRGLPNRMEAARYHSLAVSRASLPDMLTVTAETEEGEIMAVEHKHYQVYGVQFHPESVLTPDGKQILENFLAI